MFEAYKRLILEHEVLASIGQNLVQFLPLVLGRESSFVTLEGMFSLSRVQLAVNASILEKKYDPYTATERNQLLLRVIRESQCWLELLVRQRYNHRTAWQVLLLLEVVKMLLKFPLLRPKLIAVLQLIRNWAIRTLRSGSSSTVGSAGATTLGTQRPKPITDVVIPRVLRQSEADVPAHHQEQSLASTIRNAVDLYLWVRGLLVVGTAFYMFPAARLMKPMRYRPEVSCPVSAAQSLRQAVARSWKPWLFVFALDLCAWLATTRVPSTTERIVVVDDEGRSVERSQQDSASEQGLDDDATRSRLLLYLMYCGLYRDPFFAVALKRTLFSLGDWIPFPPLKFHLTHVFGLQKHSFAWSLGA